MMEEILFNGFLIILILFLVKKGISLTKQSRRKSKSFTVPPTTPYEKLLNTDEWKLKRETILKRDGYKCCNCHKGNCNLQVHHKYYLKYPNGEKVNPWEYPNKALVTLCDECHKKEHQDKQIKTYYTNKELINQFK